VVDAHLPTGLREGWTMKIVAFVSLLITTLLLSGCSPSDVINTGGDTKCKDFLTQDQKKQTDEISKMIKDKQLTDRNGAEPTPGEISSTRLMAVKYCQTIGKADPDSKITEAPHA
jgi:acid stress chaperone HdeA